MWLSLARSTGGAHKIKAKRVKNIFHPRFAVPKRKIQTPIRRAFKEGAGNEPDARKMRGRKLAFPKGIRDLKTAFLNKAYL